MLRSNLDVTSAPSARTESISGPAPARRFEALIFDWNHSDAPHGRRAACLGTWGVAVVSDGDARLLRGGLAGLTEFAVVIDQLHPRRAQGDGSRAGFQRGIDNRVAAHVRGVADRLMRAHRRFPFDHLVVACATELRAMIAHSLDDELNAILVGIIDRDLEHAAVDQIAGIVAPLIERAEREREAELVACIEERLATGGPAAAGRGEVLATLE
jgi:hypothetical protein